MAKIGLVKQSIEKWLFSTCLQGAFCKTGEFARKNANLCTMVAAGLYGGVDEATRPILNKWRKRGYSTRPFLWAFHRKENGVEFAQMAAG